MVTVWDFSRPHTLIGSLISVPMVQIFAAMPFLVQGLPGVGQALLGTIGSSLPPALFVNIYITGLNQIYDVEIDKINKPFLPIPAGRLSVQAAWLVVVTSLSLAVLFAWMQPSFVSMPLHFTLAGSAVLGSAYSMPPVRLKRSPFFAAFCIVVVRGLIVNLGFYCFALDPMRALGPAAVKPWRGGLAAIFFAVFGLVIALLKDVPDVIGDRMRGIRSLSVRVGPDRVLRWGSAVLRVLLIATTGCFGLGAVWAALCGNVGTSLCRVAITLVGMVSGLFIHNSQQGVNPRDPSGVYEFYMSVWKVFYISYLCLPLAL